MTTKGRARLTPSLEAEFRTATARVGRMHPENGKIISSIINTVDAITVDGYDPESAAAALAAFGSVLYAVLIPAITPDAGADMASYLAALAKGAALALHDLAAAEQLSTTYTVTELEHPGEDHDICRITAAGHAQANRGQLLQTEVRTTCCGTVIPLPRPMWHCQIQAEITMPTDCCDLRIAAVQTAAADPEASSQ
jgi:hypothetical protein